MSSSYSMGKASQTAKANTSIIRHVANERGGLTIFLATMMSSQTSSLRWKKSKQQGQKSMALLSLQNGASTTDLDWEKSMEKNFGQKNIETGKKVWCGPGPGHNGTRGRKQGQNWKWLFKKSTSIASHNYYIFVSYFANSLLKKRLWSIEHWEWQKRYGAALGLAIMEHEADNWM